MIRAGSRPSQPSASTVAIDPIVSPAWLSRQQGNPHLRLLDARERSRYTEGHLPGAIWFDADALNWPRLDGTITLVTAAPFAKLMSRTGIDATTSVIVYDDGDGRRAARVVWALRCYGHQQAALLSGGIAGWIAAGYPLTRAICLPYPRIFVPRLDDHQRATIGWVQCRIADRSLLLLDARPARAYARERLFHARHWPWPTALPAAATELRAILERAGITPDRRIVTYCETGEAAASVYLLLRSLGYPQVRVLDDAWQLAVRRSGG